MIFSMGPGAIGALGEKPVPIDVSADLGSEESPRVPETQHKGSYQLLVLAQTRACSMEVRSH